MGNGGRPLHTQEELLQELKLQLCWGALGYLVTRSSEPSLAGYGGHYKVFGFCINEKEATGAFEQGRDKTVYVLKGLSGCCIEYKLWSPGWKQESHYEAVVRILVMVT